MVLVMLLFSILPYLFVNLTQDPLHHDMSLYLENPCKCTRPGYQCLDKETCKKVALGYDALCKKVEYCWPCVS